MSDTNIEQLVAETRQRLENLPTQDAIDAKIAASVPTDEQIRAIVTETLEGLDTNDAIVRKLVFGREPGGLVGSKYARFGLDEADVEFLHDILDEAQKVGRSRGPSEELRNATRAIRTATGGRVQSLAVSRSQDEANIEQLHRAGVLTGEAYREAVAALDFNYGATRAMDTAESGFGAEIVGAQYVRQLWTGAQAMARVFSRIPQFEMTDGTAYLPVEAGVPEMLFVGESTANNSSNYDTVKTPSQRVAVTAKKFVIHQMWSGEIEEDSIIPFVPFLRAQATRSVALYSDSLVLNGDTTNAGTGNINLDDADPADTKHYLAFDGIRHAALVDNTGNGSNVAGPITYAALHNLRGLMLDTTRHHDWGHPDVAEDLMYVADPQTVDAISLLDEVITVDKFGNQATVLTGQQARVGAHPLISSTMVSKTEADGKVSTTGGNNTKGQVVLFNKGGFTVGVRRSVKVEVERLPGSDQTRLVYSLRMGLGRYSPTGAASGIECAAVAYNVTV